MGDDFNRREPIDTSRIHQNLEVVTLLESCQWLGFFEKLRGFHEEIGMVFAMNLQNPDGKELVNAFKGIVIYINEDFNSKVKMLPKGLHWNKEERQESITAKRGFFFPNE